jgi:hypothetical protein
MFITLNHQKLEISSTSRQFVLECYKLTKFLPIDEKFGMITKLESSVVSSFKYC